MEIEYPDGVCQKQSMTDPAAPPTGFKEWAFICEALGQGVQTIILRKGGISEGRGGFQIEHDRFFLYPTFDHQRNDLVRASHRPELRAETAAARTAL